MTLPGRAVLRVSGVNDLRYCVSWTVICIVCV